MKKKSTLCILLIIFTLLGMFSCITETKKMPEQTAELIFETQKIATPLPEEAQEIAQTTTKTEATTTATTKPTTVATQSEATVWIPKNGKKYHSYSGCSNMKNPSQVSIAYAKEHGFTMCSKCY